jgi:NAD-dependent dihydropyrimidine dehydrogenase PreA subunit
MNYYPMYNREVSPLNFFIPRFFMDKLIRGNHTAKITVETEKCTGCQNCVSSCPGGVYELINGKSVPTRMDRCLLCYACQIKCPRHAIQVVGHLPLREHLRARGALLRKIFSSKPDKDSDNK